MKNFIAFFGIVCLAGCEANFFSEKAELQAVFPEIPAEKLAAFEISSWRISFIDSGGDWQSREVPASAKFAKIAVKKNCVTPILAECRIAGSRFFFKPCGAIYPHECEGVLKLTWHGGFSAFCAKTILRSANGNSAEKRDFVNGFNWLRFKKSLEESENPWRDFSVEKAVSKIASKSVREGFFKTTQEEAKKRFAEISAGFSEKFYSDFVPEKAHFGGENLKIVQGFGAENVFFDENSVFLLNFNNENSNPLEIISIPR